MFDTAGLIEKKSKSGNLYYENASGVIVAKRCTKCNEANELIGFSKHKTSLGGVREHCNKCKNADDRRWQKNNKERVYIKNKRWTESNKERVVAVRKQYYENHKEVQLKKQSVYRKEHREISRMSETKRRTLKKYLPATLVVGDEFILLNEQNGACFLMPTSEDLQLEHFIPLSIGHGGSTYENCYFMNGTLNKSKGNRNPFEWIKTQPSEYQDRFHSILVPMLAARNEMTVEEFTKYVNWCFDNPRTIEDLQEATI